MRALARPPVGPLHARVGIATGLVVVGDLIGGRRPTSRRSSARRRTWRRACRRSPSPTGRDRRRDARLVGDLFECVDLGALAAQGLRRPGAGLAGAAAGRRPRAASRRCTPPALTPLVGREEELALLLRRWAQAKAGEGRVVLLSGEPGIGKSRLIAGAARSGIEREPHIRLRYFCSPHHQDSALYPVIAQLERAAGFGARRHARGAARQARGAARAAATPRGGRRRCWPSCCRCRAASRYPPLDLDAAAQARRGPSRRCCSSSRRWRAHGRVLIDLRGRALDRPDARASCST